MNRVLLRRFWIFLNVVKILFLLFCVSALGLFIGTFISISQILPNSQDIYSLKSFEGTKIYSEDGVLLAEFTEENREVVPISKIPKDLINATIAVEDSRFYSHPGVDLRSIARAFWADLRSLKIVQGGSTITQQLARNIYLTRKRTFSRKLQEVMLALQIERRFSKEEILELYLNEICYGHGAYGVQVASKLYFGKDVSELNLAESAMLAGLPRLPSYYSPYTYPEAAKRRQKAVLDRMVSLGFISRREAAEAEKVPLKLAGLRPAPRNPYKLAPYFDDYIINYLKQKYGSEALYKGGLKVYTTLDSRLQKAAEEALQYGLEMAKRRRLRVTEGAIVAIEPQTGYIKAMVGGKNFWESQWNCATQARRQAGSAFKPFIYTAAIDSGFSPSYTIRDSPVRYHMYGNKYWQPRNYSGRYSYRALTLRTALAHSVNVVAVKLLEKVGVEKVIDYAHRMGIKQNLEPNLSLALGTSGVTPLEMACAFGVIANKGIRAEPIAIKKITYGDGTVLEETEPRTRRVLSAKTAAIMYDLLRDVIRYGTGTRARIGDNEAGKTGTTSDYKDAWFVGFTPNLSVAVWMGNRDNSPTRRVVGGSLPAPTWAYFMKKAVKLMQPERERLEVTEEPKPERQIEIKPPKIRLEATIAVTICTQSGKIATEYCPQTATKRFPKSQVPSETCSIHEQEPEGE